MRIKLALIAVFASFLVAALLGSSAAGADPLGESTAVEPSPTTTTAVPALQAPACANGIDDDGDGLVDMADPDCTEPGDTSEAPEPPSSNPAAAPSPASPVSPSTPTSGSEEATEKVGGGFDQG